MASAFKSQGLNSKDFVVLFAIIFYLFYLSFSLGFLLSKIFYGFFDQMHKTDPYKRIKFRKKFNLVNIIKFLIYCILKFFKNCRLRIFRKFLFLGEGIYLLINILIIYKQKVKKIFKKKLKPFIKFKCYLRLLKELWPYFWGVVLAMLALKNEVSFVANIIKSLIEWKHYLLFFASQYVWVNRAMHILYLIFISLVGILLGFLLGVYKRRNEKYILVLLLLLITLYNHGFEEILSEMVKTDPFSEFSFKPMPEIEPKASKLNLKAVDKMPLPFSVIEDPLLFIETEVLL